MSLWAWQLLNTETVPRRHQVLELLQQLVAVLWQYCPQFAKPKLETVIKVRNKP